MRESCALHRVSLTLIGNLCRDWHEQQSSSKKDSETTNGASNGRERRYVYQSHAVFYVASRPLAGSAVTQRKEVGTLSYIVMTQLKSVSRFPSCQLPLCVVTAVANGKLQTPASAL